MKLILHGCDDRPENVRNAARTLDKRSTCRAEAPDLAIHYVHYVPASTHKPLHPWYNASLNFTLLH